MTAGDPGAGGGDAPLGRAERIHRSRARSWAVQIHYRWESGGGEGTLRDALVDTMATRRIAAPRLPYIRRLLSGLDEHGAEVDRALTDALENWSLERLSTVDRAVLRLAALEILRFDDVPPRVSIQEAIGLAEQYGGGQSPRFVNGVLDALYRRAADGA